MIYLDNGATSLHKPPSVKKAMLWAMENCANPGRGGYPTAMAAAETVYRCRETAAELFDCMPEQVVLTPGCTFGLNMAIRTLINPGDRVVITGFEHNAVTRPLHILGAKVRVAGRKLFCWDEMLENWEKQLNNGADAAVFTHVSNVFGYILPVGEMADMCRKRGVPFIIDAAQSAGVLPVSLRKLGADFIAMPGHKGLLGPQGTGILLCGRLPKPLTAGGTGSESENQSMPDFLPDIGEAGTPNVPGIAGLGAAMEFICGDGTNRIFRREHEAMACCAEGLRKMGVRVFSGEHQAATVSFLPAGDCEETARALAERGIALRAGLHCAPLAHESAGTLKTGTVRVSFGRDASFAQVERFLEELQGVS